MRTPIVLRDPLETLLHLIAHLGNRVHQLLHRVRFGLHEQHEVGRVELLGVLVEKAVTLAEHLALLAQLGGLRGRFVARFSDMGTARREGGEEKGEQQSGSREHGRIRGSAE